MREKLFIFIAALFLISCTPGADLTTPSATVVPTVISEATATVEILETLAPTLLPSDMEFDTSPLAIPYLGQTPPGDTPEIFAPGFISTENALEGSSTFYPDGTEFYFTKIMPDGGYYVMVTILDGDQWTEPTKASFNPDIVFDGTEAMITPDGTKLFFFSKRPLPGESGQSNFPNIWVTNRIDDGWSEPELFSSEMMYVTQAASGTIYFTHTTARPQRIAASQLLSDGSYTTPQAVDIPSLPSGSHGHPFIAPDESYLIFNSIPSSGGNMDLSITFKMEDGLWSDALNLGETINTDANEFFAMVSPDGKYFFFTREDDGSEDIYWMSASFIDTLKLQALSQE